MTAGGWTTSVCGGGAGAGAGAGVGSGAGGGGATGAALGPLPGVNVIDSPICTSAGGSGREFDGPRIKDVAVRAPRTTTRTAATAGAAVRTFGHMDLIVHVGDEDNMRGHMPGDSWLRAANVIER